MFVCLPEVPVRTTGVLLALAGTGGIMAQRITHLTVTIGLSSTGYHVRVAAMGPVPGDRMGTFHSEDYPHLSWREAQQVVDALCDTYRPGLELLDGGAQHPLF